MPYVITSLCKKHGLCVEVCPVDAIEEGDDQYYIDPDTCIECGTCEGECPEEAIFLDEDLPEEYEEDIDRNAAFFA